MSERLVVWDIDGTLVRPSMERLLLDYLRARGIVSLWRLPADFIKLLPSSGGKWHRLKLSYLKGRALDDVDRWMDDCVDSIITANLVSPCTIALERLRDDGVTQLLLSGTIHGLAERLANHLGVNHVVAAEPEVYDDRYTGRLIAAHPYGTRKTRYANDWLQKNGFDWFQTAVVADHWQDRFLLERAGLPLVVNPEDRISRYARDRGWTVLSERDANLTAERIVETVTAVR